MKSEVIKLMACMCVGTMVLSGSAGIALAAPADAEITATPSDSQEISFSGISMILASEAEQDHALETAESGKAAIPAAVQETDAGKKAEDKKYENMGVARVDKYLNIRKKPDTNSKIVGKLNKNAVATVVKEKKGWYQIKSGSVSGYVKKEYLTVGDKQLLDSVKYRVAKVTTETLRVREKASEDAGVIGLVGLEDKLKVLDEKTEGWVKVKTDDGKGYVSADYVKLSDAYHHAVKVKANSKKTDSGSGNGSVADYALQFVGNPYAWGGTSLTHGADCSGFVKSVYAHFGVSLPHSSGAQRSVGRGVSYSEAQPGDIICYSGHVGIYIGGGKIVHASNPSDGIKVSPATYASILSVRRVL